MTGNETWSGTIELTGDVTVPAGITLTIQPGTRVACWDKIDQSTLTTGGGTNTSRIELIVDHGVLLAVGTAANPIRFTSAPVAPPAVAGDWFGVRLNIGTNNATRLEHCVIEYATEGLRIEAGRPALANLTLRTNSVSGISVGSVLETTGLTLIGNTAGIHANSSASFSPSVRLTNGVLTGSRNLFEGNFGEVLLSSCTVTSNKYIGTAWCGGNGCINPLYSTRVTVEDCTFDGSGAGAYNTLGNLSVLRSSFRNCGQLLVSDCTLRDSEFLETGVLFNWEPVNGVIRADNIVVRGAPSVGLAARLLYLTNCIIEDCQGPGVDSASRYDPSTVHLERCVVRGNHGGVSTDNVLEAVGCSIIQNTGAGLSCAVIGPAGITGNIIQGNEIGLSLGNGRTTISGLTSNSITGNTVFELKNVGSSAIIATNNYWGEPTTSELQAPRPVLTRIYDSRFVPTPNPAVGAVYLTPYLTQDPFNVPTPVAPVITLQPADLMAPVGGTARFSIAATGTDPLAFQWRLNGSTALANSARISGATGVELVLTSLTAADEGSYHVVVTNVAGRTESRAALLTVIPKPVITEQPISRIVAPGGAVTFTVVATNRDPNVGYQWRFRGTAIPGATSPSYTIPAARTDQMGEYTVDVTNMAGTVTSAPAALWLLDLRSFAGLILQAPAQSSCRIEFTTDLKQQTGWQVLTNVTLSDSPQIFIDYDSPQSPKRFYRVIPQ